jgi:hypothetical protein
VRQPRADLEDLGTREALEVGVGVQPQADDGGDLDEKARLAVLRDRPEVEGERPRLPLDEGVRVSGDEAAQLHGERIDRALCERDEGVPVSIAPPRTVLGDEQRAPG